MKKCGSVLIRCGIILLPVAALVKLAFRSYTMTALCLVFLAFCFLFFGCMRRWNTKVTKVLSLLFVLCLIAGSGLFLAMEIPILGAACTEENTDAPYGIVFGAAVHGSKPSLAMAERCEAALAWMEEHPDSKVIVSGGQGSGEQLTEAQAMTDYLTSRGADPSRILQEPEATSSYENLVYSLRVLESDGGDPAGRAALISSEYHLYRLKQMAEQLGCDPVCVAAKTAIFPLRVNYYIREAFAMWKVRLFGIE